ncbi:HIT family protein [Natrialbaceae archaeon AArc-T1-2]|uniref:HIT family protein n=1 Tax=Natrialbaceae archaeon AArc-T1-2 TaxID=3053904 RepID=UPI00255AC5C5|nr:HIT family protein [Natrialbaceae archaeon AArc-T1-2]WIV68317.1 HIT family protein [Natrialbaceae archaeon AArc-T1-2]
MSTIFTQIVDGEIPADIVYENETTCAFLDANPLAPGHTLVIPKDEYTRIDDLPADVARELFATVHRLVPAVEDAVDADATTVGFNNGTAAGQEVDHVHCHIVPRFEDDAGGTLHSALGGPTELADDDRESIAADIESRV